MFSIIILAAGESKRFGELKQIYPIQNQTFLKKILDNIERLNTSKEILIGVGYKKKKVISELKKIKYNGKIVHNDHFQDGPLSTLKACLQQTNKDSQGFLMILSDHPLVQYLTYKKIIDQFNQSQDEDIIIPQYKNRNGHPVLFPASFKEQILKAPLEQGARWVIQKNRNKVHYIQVRDPYILADIDNKEILKEYLNQLNYSKKETS